MYSTFSLYSMFRPPSDIRRDLGFHHPHIHEPRQEASHRPTEMLDRRSRIELSLDDQQQPTLRPSRREVVQNIVSIYPRPDRLRSFQVCSSDVLGKGKRHLLQVRRRDRPQDGVDIRKETHGVRQLDFHVSQGCEAGQGGMIKTRACFRPKLAVALIAVKVDKH